MEDTDGSALAVDQNDRQAIGSLHRKQNSRRAGDQAIADKWCRRRFCDAMDEIGMDLSQRDQRPRFLPSHHPNAAEKRLAIALDRSSRIMPGEAKIQGIPAIDTREPTGAGRKTMHQPWDGIERLGAEDRKFGPLRGHGQDLGFFLHESSFMSTGPARACASRWLVRTREPIAALPLLPRLARQSAIRLADLLG